jgi:MFS family permease
MVSERLPWLVLQGMVAGIATAGMATLWIDTLIVQSFWTGRGWRIGVNALSAGVGHLCAPMLGVALLVHAGWQLSALYLGALLGGLALVLACCMPPLLGTETGRAAVPPAGPLATQRWSAVFSSSPWWQINIVAGLWGLANALVGPWARGTLTRGPDLFGTFETLMLGMGSMLLAGLVSGVLFGVLADRLGRKPTLTLACLAHVVAYALPLLWPHPLSGALAGLLQGLLVAALVPVLTPLLGEIYGLRHLGTLVGLLAVGRHLGYSLGVWLGAASAAWIGREEGVGILAAVALGGAACVSAAIPERRYSVRYRPPAAAAS